MHDELMRLAVGKGEGPPVRIHLGGKVIQCSPEDGTITLKGGEIVHADLVVGADGLHVRPYSIRLFILNFTNIFSSLRYEPVCWATLRRRLLRGFPASAALLTPPSYGTSTTPNGSPAGSPGCEGCPSKEKIFACSLCIHAGLEALSTSSPCTQIHTKTIQVRAYLNNHHLSSLNHLQIQTGLRWGRARSSCKDSTTSTPSSLHFSPWWTTRFSDGSCVCYRFWTPGFAGARRSSVMPRMPRSQH